MFLYSYSFKFIKFMSFPDSLYGLFQGEGELGVLLLYEIKLLFDQPEFFKY